jgi:hypothetical protein
MLAPVSSASNASWTYLNNDPTQDPTQDPTAGQDPSGQTQSSQASPGQQKPVNTASAVAELRKAEQSVAEQLQKAQTGPQTPAGQAMVELLATQITAIQTQINNIVGLNSMRTQNRSITSVQSSSKSKSQSLRMMNQTQKTNQAQKAQQHKSVTEMAESNTSSNGTAKPFRFDLTGSMVDEVA